jgi:hypothetical protein
MIDGGDPRKEQMRAEVRSRAEDLQTLSQRKAVAHDFARRFRLQEQFVLGFIEDVLGAPAPPTTAELERSARATRPQIPAAED